jgi:RES domain-containing protein
MNLWRLTKYASLSGEGGRLYTARWNNAGAPIVYLADTPASAMVEVLVHLEIADDEIPTDFIWLRVSVPDKLLIHAIHPPAGESWRSELPLTRRLGDRWLTSQRSALARVPSALMPQTSNYLLNPLHPDAKRIKIAAAEPAVFDMRLLRR